MLVGWEVAETGDFLAAALVVIVALGVLREPAAENSHLLRKDLMDAPEAGKGSRTGDGRQHYIINKKGPDAESEACGEKYPPTALAPMIFHLYDYRVAYSYDKEDCRADYDSVKVHFSFV